MRAKDARLVRGATAKAKPAEKAEFITITAEAHSARGAALVANTTAELFIKRQSSDARRGIERQIALSRRQLGRLEAAAAPKVAPTTSGSKSGTSTRATSTAEIIQIANLSTKINQLESSLTTTSALQVKPAKPHNARQVAPKPRQNAIFGFVIGIVLASIAAYAIGRFDRRVRSLAGVTSLYGLQILAGMPKVNRPIVRREGLPTPSRLLLEPLRRLHTALELGRGSERQETPWVTLITSADPGDGKSTLVADLALVQREAGQRVAIVEANFRQPVQAKLLGLDGQYGLAEVLAGMIPLEDALQRVMPVQVPAGEEAVSAAGGVATAVQMPHAGALFVLTGSGGVANPPMLLGGEAMSGLLRTMGEEYDHVLVDGPSPVEVSDMMPLLGMVDSIVVVSRIAHTREMAAQRLTQLLEDVPHAPIAGIVANCVPPKEARRYGFASSDRRMRPGRLISR